METKNEDYSAALLAEEDRNGHEGDGLWIARPSRALFSSCRRCLLHILALYASNTISLIIIIILWNTKSKGISASDPSLKIYCKLMHIWTGELELNPRPATAPANEAVEYVEALHFRAALFNHTEYMGYPTADGRTDELWSDLYNFGISKIKKEQAAKLHTPTLAIPGTEDYLIELDVWHELHCLNDLRKVLYPEVYGGLLEVTWPNGTINRNTDAFRHWDHCIDSLRQTIMCHADVAPIPFHVNVPQWARDNWAGDWDFHLNPEKAEEIITASGFDNAPEEDIEFLWRDFPGNQFFRHWRENPVN
ncbi:hypothetical protein PT974_05013 [Cladobotryum mycophilum]|uniref:Uncharacterized protein n=1 Tax=Cladobotryum mycophilum TaxID=491253 RepID=A0ABR0SS34_9HYPO